MIKPRLRTCTGCRTVRDKREMIRIVRTPEGEYCVDRTGKKNGRGCYICPDRSCLDLAFKRKGLERSFGSPVPAQIHEALLCELEVNKGL